MTLEEQQFILPKFWRDTSAIAQDNLCSLVGGDFSEKLSSLLETELGHQISGSDMEVVVRQNPCPVNIPYNIS